MIRGIRSRTNSKVDEYLRKRKKWQGEMAELRKVALDCQLTEELKWGKPCYTFQKSNVVIIQGFKEYLALMFFKGALLKDANGILIKPGENAQAGRQIRFTDLREIVDMDSTLKAYIREAVEVEKAGLKVKLKATAEYAMPEELKKRLEEGSALKAAFQGLTPGRQRAYILHFSAPKQSRTRESRIDRCVQRILNGKGLNDR